MPLGFEQLPDYARVWSAALFGIGIAALLFSFRRTVSLQRKRGRAAGAKTGVRLSQVKAVIDDISLREQFVKRQRVLAIPRISGPNQDQRNKLAQITASQARRRSS